MGIFCDILVYLTDNFGSHHNAVVNAALAELQVVGVVMEHLASSQMEIRKAATLFLAGIVAAGSVSLCPLSTNQYAADPCCSICQEHARAIADYTHPAGAVDGVELLLVSRLTPARPI